MKTAVYIDVSALSATILRLRETFDAETFEKVLRHTIYDTSKKIKTISKRRIREEYQIAAGRIDRSFGAPWITTGSTISCLIPIKDVRGTIAKTGGAYEALKRGGPQGKIVKTGNSLLPHSKGDERIHFYISKGRLAGHIFVRHADGKRWRGRSGKLQKGSISHGVGIGVPQMPMNRSEDAIQADILAYMEKRLVHYETQLLNKAK